jgi:hypothetical protein
MKIDDKVNVHCTDSETNAEGTIVSITKNSLRVLLNGVPLWFKRTKTGVYVGNSHGMEFVIKREI